MELDQLPFRDAGIDEDIGRKITHAIFRTLVETPDKPVEILNISTVSGYPPLFVKPVFYLLLAFRLLKATFLPRHRPCGRVIGHQEVSAEIVREKFFAGTFGTHCTICHEPLENIEDIDIQIVFWKPGADVEQ
jgi:hypothetical protein